MKFAEAAFAFAIVEDEFTTKLCELDCGEFNRLTWDWYDNSLELKGVTVGYQINDAALDFIWSEGFSQMWLCYTDGSEVFCRKGGKPAVTKGPRT